MGLHTLKDSIKKLAGTFGKDIVALYIGEVVSVDINNRTCNVSTIHADATIVLENVSIQMERSDGLIPIPAIDSTVLLGITTQQKAVVLLYSDLSSYSIIVGKSRMITTAALIQLNDGAYNGLVIGEEVANEINSLKDDLNNLKAAFAAWVVVPSDGGAALKAITATWAAQTLAPTLEGTLENAYITHGQPT